MNLSAVDHLIGRVASPARRRAAKAMLGRVMKVNSSRQRLWLENKAFAESIPAHALVLDAGAGAAPYKPLLGHTRYESADFEQVDKIYARSTYVCDLAAIPVEDDRFDAIFFNQVLEHVPEPKLVIWELYRVLKPGGRMIYSAPLFYEEHEQPYDFYRYTQFAVRYLFTRAGFRIDRLDWLEGYYSTVAHQMNRMARHLFTRPAEVAPGALGYVLAPVMFLLRLQMAALGRAFHWLEMRHKVTQRGHPKNYIAILSKPDSV
jgi:SAM-dependent methyltransferase